MLYKFKSRATADVIMLEVNGRQVLEILGKPLNEQHGIITVEQIPAAISALEAAAARDNAQRKEQAVEAGEDPVGDDSNVASGADVGLSQRVAPLLDMLRRSAAEGREVVW